MVNPLEAVIMHSMGDYMNLKSVNVTKEDARLSLIRIIVYLESHPEIPGECVTILWSVLKHITASGQDGEISDVLASERSSDNVDNDEQDMGSGQDGKISCVNASECSSDYNGVCNDQQGICERGLYCILMLVIYMSPPPSSLCVNLDIILIISYSWHREHKYIQYKNHHHTRIGLNRHQSVLTTSTWYCSIIHKTAIEVIMFNNYFVYY